MNLLKSNINLFEEILSLVKDAKEDLTIFSPYIKLKAISKLLDGIHKKINVTIITSWKPVDIAFGSSDLSIYPFCKENNFRLLINNKIHLKTIIIDNMSRAYIGSANITESGLGYSQRHNYEIGSIESKIDIDDQIYFDKIIESSSTISDDYYTSIIEEAKKLKKPKIDQNFSTEINSKDNFLLTALPMCDSVEDFYSIYSRKDVNDFKTTELRSAEHDKRLYNIPDGLPKSDFIHKLKDNFLKHPFITEYIRFIDDEKYFGQVSTWLHDTVTTVPSPRRYEIKEFQKRVNKYLTFLSDEYEIVTPGRKSQKLFRVQR